MRPLRFLNTCCVSPYCFLKICCIDNVRWLRAHGCCTRKPRCTLAGFSLRILSARRQIGCVSFNSDDSDNVRFMPYDK